MIVADPTDALAAALKVTVAETPGVKTTFGGAVTSLGKPLNVMLTVALKPFRGVAITDNC